MPKQIVLKNKPLVEAIFELRWAFDNSHEAGSHSSTDPHYKILVGRVYDRLSQQYRFHEPLPSASVPDEILGQVVQHRFRVARDDWPLIQMGPGIITLNDTSKYSWKDFRSRISSLVEVFFEVHPERDKVRFDSLFLRYIDAMEFDYEKTDVFEFLRDKMNIGVDIYPRLFKGTGVRKPSLNLDLRFSFPCEKPKGAASLRFAKGKSNKTNTDALVWETMVRSKGEDASLYRDKVDLWVRKAHTVTDNWFFMMIEGDLLKRFK